MINALLSALTPSAVTNSFSPDQEHMWRMAGTGGATVSGIYVSENRALQLPVVLDCLKVLSETVATLPLHIYERTGEDTRRRVDNHPLADVLAVQPNDTNTAFEFFQAMTWRCAWERNAYAEIVPGPRGAVDQLKPLKQVMCERTAAGGHQYRVYDENGAERILFPDEVWHWRAAPLDSTGLCGQPVMHTSREVIGRALAVQQYGSAFFANGGMSGGVIEGPGFKTADDQSRFLDAWRRARTGHNAHKDAVLMPGMKYTPNIVSNEAAQFIETEKQQDMQLARIWRMQPHKVGILDRATFTNIEQQNIEHVVDTIMPWLVMIEQAISRDLIVANRRYYAQFNVNGMLRGDTGSRFEAYAKAIQSGWLSPNDVRRLENLDPIPGGDTYFRNAALVPLDSPPNPPPLTAQASSDLSKAMDLLKKTQEEVEASDGGETE